MGIDTKKIESTRLDEEAHKKLKKFQGASYNKKIEDEKTSALATSYRYILEDTGGCPE